MDKKTEALKLALERLEWFVESYPHDITTNKEEFLRPFKEALAHAPTVREQPAQQQEPVTYWDLSENEMPIRPRLYDPEEHHNHVPLYTSPPASKPWVGLTDEEIESAMPGGIYDCLADPWDCNVGDGDYMRSIKKDVLRVARAAIAAYEEKNGITGEKA